MNKLLAIIICAFTFHVGAAKQPNVVFILADDLGVNDLSLYGSTFYETPHIDALAKRSQPLPTRSQVSRTARPSLL